jgi:hypothetical protein
MCEVTGLFTIDFTFKCDFSPSSRLNGCIHFCIILSGVHFDLALFVPNQSQHTKLGSNTSAPAEPEQIDLSWQLSLQTVWEKLLQDKGSCEI